MFGSNIARSALAVVLTGTLSQPRVAHATRVAAIRGEADADVAQG
jgi:hypothetical protein